MLKIPAKTHVKINAPFTQNGRVRVTLNGVPVAHKQILELDRGLYPMLVVVRLRTKWAALAAGFEAATPEEIKSARQYAAEMARKKATSNQSPGQQGPATDAPVIRRATDVKKGDRKNLFWVPDRELAEAWLRLHARKF